MVELTMNAIAYVTRAKTKGMNQDVIVSEVSTDTRNFPMGALFVALRGDNFDGHNFAKQALEMGACAVVVEDDEGLPEDKVLVVKDTRKAYLDIAHLHRSKCPAKVIAVTGSVGKTTTKEMIACILGAVGRTIKTKHNLNNEVGLAHMLLEIKPTHEYAVLELGVDGPNQMLPMALAVAPDIAVITNIGITHLEAFGSVENIQKEKFTLAEGLRNDGTMVLNADDPLLSAQLKGHSLFYFGIRALSAEVQARNLRLQNDFTEFDLLYKNNRYLVHLPIAGVHNIYNALAAFSVAALLDIDMKTCIDAIYRFEVEGMRQKTVGHNGVTVIEDCYNAGPASMKAALKTLGSMATVGRRIAVLSDMLELGDKSYEEHYKVAEMLKKYKIDMLFATGEQAKIYMEAAKEFGYGNAYYFDNKKELAEALKKELKPRDIVWVKGSRGTHLEEVLEEIYKE